VLSLRFDEVIEFYLKKGLDLSANFPDALHILIFTASLFPEDPPVTTLELLIKYGMPVNNKDIEKGRTPLHLACKYGIMEYVKILLSNGADLNSPDNKFKTPLKILGKKATKPRF